MLRQHWNCCLGGTSGGESHLSGSGRSSASQPPIGVDIMPSPNSGIAGGNTSLTVIRRRGRVTLRPGTSQTSSRGKWSFKPPIPLPSARIAKDGVGDERRKKEKRKDRRKQNQGEGKTRLHLTVDLLEAVSGQSLACRRSVKPPYNACMRCLAVLAVRKQCRRSKETDW